MTGQQRETLSRTVAHDNSTAVQSSGNDSPFSKALLTLCTTPWSSKRKPALSRQIRGFSASVENSLTRARLEMRGRLEGKKSVLSWQIFYAAVRPA